ncbi:AraC family transcriptional regulator [Rubellimicrobium arenae]|uniref:AraC family transcriptional regulator n=1 Tax=Rubellimicrobium arenae TaxID=2817372 RepID=UPI001B30E144|nr:AraC family transcriptional regulator [Rubellimicrobium arenae]
MAFRPNMTAFTDGIRLLGGLRWRSWDGTVADLWEATGDNGGCGQYESPDPRIVVFLGDGPAPIRLSARPGGSTAGKVAFVPAGQPIWSQVVEARPFRHLDLHFDRAHLTRRLRDRQDTRRRATLDRPVLLDGHPQVEHLAGLLAAEVTEPRHDDLVPEALATAMLGMILALPPEADPDASRGGLTPAQLRRVVDLMQSELHRKLSVAEMADAAGLSESWFAHAFRQSMGISPVRHLTRLRIDAARRLLLGGGPTIGEIAVATGFADQAHFTRVFREATGTTPAAWRRHHGI